jgi:hypothetical protein
MKDETKECATASTSYELLLHSSLFSSASNANCLARVIYN